MRKITLFLFSMLLTLGLGAQELIVNGDFETGDKTGWLGYNNAVDAAEGVGGSFAGRINDNADGSLLQIPLVTAGNTYNVTFSARWSADPGNASILIALQKNPGNIKFAETDKVTATEWTTVSTQLTVPPGVDKMRVVMYKAKSPKLWIDNVSVTDAGAIKPALAATFDGNITEGSEAGEVISVEMLNDVFSATLDPAAWTFEGIPEGLSVGSVERVSDTQANITLTGTAADYDDVRRLYLTVAASEFVTYTESVKAGYEVVFTGIKEPPPAISLVTSGDIVEDFEDGTVISVEMDDDTFVDPITPANWTGLNLPEGVSIGAVERVNDTAVHVTLSGNTTGDYDLDITNAGLSIAAAEFTTWLDPVEVTGLTFVAAIEGGEDVLWEENFNGFADGTDLTDTIGGNDIGFIWQLMDSAMVYGGELALYPTAAKAWSSDSVDHRFQYIFSPISMGKTYIFYMDSKTNDGATTVASVLVGEGGQFKTDPTGSTEFRTRSVIVEPFLAGHDTAGVGIYNWGWNIADRIIYVDNMKLVVLTEPKISAADDGELMEGAEDGEIITISLQNDVFAASLDIANWTISNMPEGVSASAISRVDDTHAQITLSGNSTSDYDVNITNIEITASRDEFVTSNKNLHTSGGVEFTAVVEPAAITIADDGEIMEGSEDGEVITVSLTLDTFVATLTPANWTVSNLPAGVSVGEVFRVDDVTVEIVLSGNTTEDYDTDITDLSVSIAAAELTEWESAISVSTGVTFIAIVETVGIANFAIEGLSVYPNPVLEHLTLNAENEISGVEVYNILGEKTASYTEVNSRTLTLNATKWESGIYILDISDVLGNSSQVKVVK